MSDNDSPNNYISKSPKDLNNKDILTLKYLNL